MASGGLIISVAALVFFLRRLEGHWGEMAQAFRRARYIYLVPALAMLVVLYACRIARWRLFLKPIKSVRWLNSTSATMIGFTANNVLPARLGELIRPYLLHRSENVNFGHALATIGLARLFDLLGLAVLLLTTWGLLAISSPVDSDRPVPVEDDVSPDAWQENTAATAGRNDRPQEQDQDDLLQKVWTGGLIAAAMAVVGTIILLGLALFPTPALKLGEACAHILPVAWQGPVIGLMRSVVEAIGFLTDWRGVLIALGLSVGTWAAQGLSTWALAEGLGMQLGAAGAFLAVIAVAAAVAVPQAPGFLGTFHLAASLAAETFQTARGDAAAFALLMWLINIVPVTLVGFAFLAYEGLTLSKLTHESRDLEEEERKKIDEAISRRTR